MTSRRDWLIAGLGTTLAGSAALGQQAGGEAQATPYSKKVPLVLPRTELVYEAKVDIAPTMKLGNSPFGERRMVPITGGTFEGPGIKGKVLPGGADRQLVRQDGGTALDAVYELETHDGVVISVRNTVLTRPNRQDARLPRYAFSTLQIIAPAGPYGWLNDWVYVGTLNSLRPEMEAVLIRVYKLV